MERVIKNITALIITILILFASQSKASTATRTELSDEELAVSVRAIVAGKVARIESRRSSDGETIYTDITIDLSKVIKGEIKSDRIVIEQLGGQFGDRQAWLIGSPSFQLGEEVLLFLNADSRGVLHSAHLSLGKISIKKGFYELSAKARVAGRGAIDPDNLNLFTDQLAKTLTESADLARRYDEMYGNDFKLMPPDYEPGKGELHNSFNSFEDNFTFLNSRFYQPDTDMPVTFLVNPAAAPSSDVVGIEVARAITAWNSAGSRLRLVNGGMSSQCGFKADQNSVISFGDCDGVLDDPVAGQGGATFGVMVVSGSLTRIINGKSFTPIIEADIVFNNGFDALFRGTANLEELVTHAIGTAFGLDESSKDPDEADPVLRDAIMYFIPHFNGRGASLGQDDVFGVKQLYPFFTSVQLPSGALRPATINVDYLAQAFASAGFPPYTFTLVSGRLPMGLTINSMGIITGRPTTIETTNFTLMVVDSANFTTMGDFSISVLAVRPQIASISPSRVCYNGNSALTIKGTGFLGTTSVSLTVGSVVNFRVVDDATIQALITAPGMTGMLTNVTVVNPAGTSTLNTQLSYAGPFLTKATVGKVTRKNKNGKIVTTNGITVFGQGVGFNQKIRINGAAVDLTNDRDAQTGDVIYYGKLKNILPKKGTFTVSVFEPDLNDCGSNEITVKR